MTCALHIHDTWLSKKWCHLFCAVLNWNLWWFCCTICIVECIQLQKHIDHVHVIYSINRRAERCLSLAKQKQHTASYLCLFLFCLISRGHHPSSSKFLVPKWKHCIPGNLPESRACGTVCSTVKISNLANFLGRQFTGIANTVRDYQHNVDSHQLGGRFIKWVPRAFKRDSVHCGSMSERHWGQEEETATERKQVIKLRQCRPTERGRGWRYAETRLAGNKKWISESLTPLNTDTHSLFSVVLCCPTLSLALYLNPLSASVGGCPPIRKWRSLYLPQGGLGGVGAHTLARLNVELYRNENMQESRREILFNGRVHSGMGGSCVEGDKWTTPTWDKCVDFPWIQGRLHRFIGSFIIRSTVSQASKHTSCYSLAFALLHVLKVKKLQ